MALPFLDTNILLRHLRQDHPQHSPKATALIVQIETGQVQVFLSEIVVFETVFTLERSYKIPKPLIQAALLPIINLPGITMLGKRKFKDVFDLYVSLNIPFPDAYLAIHMKQRRSTDIYSFDGDFDKISHVTRLEPQL
jgi:predicted nucleic acid-binding protein